MRECDPSSVGGSAYAPVMKRILMSTVVAGAALIGGAINSEAPAGAIPGDPMAGCETQVFANYCDGPVRPDGSWKRCLFARGQYTGGFGDVPGVYTPPVENCFVVPGPDQIPPLPLGQPPHHIDE